MSYAASTYGGEGGFVPSAPGSNTQSTTPREEHQPVIPSPSRGHAALGATWHPGGPSYIRGGVGGGGGDNSWMSFGEPRQAVFPPAQQQHPWANAGVGVPGTVRGRSQDQLRPDAMYTGYGQSPYGVPMNIPVGHGHGHGHGHGVPVGGPSPYMNPNMMGPDPYFSHGGYAVPHATPAGFGNMPMNMMYGGTPGIYPQHMGGGGGGGHPWGSPGLGPGDLGLPRNFHEPETGLGSKRMGRTYDQAVFVDKWEPGKHCMCL